MARQHGLIVFVNKAETPDVPYLTLEVKNGANVQFRGLKNGVGNDGVTPPEDAILAVKHYLRQINRVLVFGENKIEIDEIKAKELFVA